MKYFSNILKYLNADINFYIKETDDIGTLESVDIKNKKISVSVESINGNSEFYWSDDYTIVPLLNPFYKIKEVLKGLISAWEMVDMEYYSYSISEKNGSIFIIKTDLDTGSYDKILVFTTKDCISKCPLDIYEYLVMEHLDTDMLINSGFALDKNENRFNRHYLVNNSELNKYPEKENDTQSIEVFISLGLNCPVLKYRYNYDEKHWENSNPDGLIYWDDDISYWYNV